VRFLTVPAQPTDQHWRHSVDPVRLPRSAFDERQPWLTTRLDEESDMALTDDLEDDISRINSTTTVTKEGHNVAIVGQTHAFLKSTDLEIRTFGRRSSNTSCCKKPSKCSSDAHDGCTPGLAAARPVGIEPCAHAD
jgi:hypothetical protein